MTRLRKAWRLFPAKRDLATIISHELNISEFIAQTLINRGLANPETVKEFLYADVETIPSPYLLKDMEKAVGRIIQAIASGEKITVYGDYDVDGITSCVIVYNTLRRLGAVVDYYIPDRQSEGYGLNGSALASLIEAGTTLLITVDCGISAVNEAATVRGRLDIVVTDHHQPPPELPQVLAIINPKQPDCLYPEKNLAGVGVAFKLCQALWQRHQGPETKFLDYLDIVAIGTIADIVPLTGENRILVKTGLANISTTSNIGLQALLEVCGLCKKPINSGSVGYIIAPRLNAAGRVGHATAGVELLLTENYEQALELAKFLDTENLARQAIEKAILAKVEEQLAELDLTAAKVLVLEDQEWHTGVIGIVASRLVDKYYRPVIMLSVRDGYGKGSCRSIPAFDMYAALSRCADLLTQFGGHRQAAGLTLPVENIAELRQRLNSIAAEILTETDYIPVLNIDSVVPVEEVSAAFIEQLACLEPYGFGNPSPVFACRDVVLSEKRSIGQQGQHLKLKLRTHAVNDVIAWNMGDLADSLHCNNNIDMAFFPKYNEWQGQKKLQLTAHDVRQSLSEQEKKSKLDQIAPDRTIIGQVYLILKEELKQTGQSVLTAQTISTKIFAKYQTGVSDDVITKAITILKELNLLTLTSNTTQLGAYNISLLPSPTKKLDLLCSPTFCASLKLREQYLVQREQF